jgi:hypothetical protein
MEDEVQLPSLTTQETKRLRSDYPSIEHLEAGNVAAWLVERQEQLLVRAKDERTGMNLAKLLTLAGGAVGAVCYATSPLAPIGALVAGVGYVWSIAQDMNDSHQFAPIPFVRGNFLEFLSAMGDKDARDEYFASQNELVDLMFHLDPFERYEFGMLKEHAHVLSEYLVRIEPGKRFYAYRWLFDWFVNLRGTFPGVEQLNSHMATVTADPRINYQQVTAIQEYQAQVRLPQMGIPPTNTAPLPETKTASLPTPKFADLPGASIGKDTKVDAIEVQAVEEKPEQQKSDNLNGIPSARIPQASQPATIPDLEQALEILDALVKTRRSTLLIGDTGAGKSVTQAYILNNLFQLHPGTEVFILAQKADSFCGLAEKGRVTLFDPTEPEQALTLITKIWRIYDERRRLPESERPSLHPVRLILADWLSINQALEDMKNEEEVKNSKYLTKLADIIYNGRELNVCLLVDLQSYNLAAVGLKADRNSRKNFNLIGLGNYSIDELGMVNESYGVLINLIGDRYIVADESERAALNATFKELQPISKANQRPIIFSGLSPARLALLPDLRKYKTSTITASSKQALATPELPEALGEEEERVHAQATAELNVSEVLADTLAEPLKSIWLFAKKKEGWITAKDIYKNEMSALKGKTVKNIRQYLGLLADKGLGEIDEMDGDKPKSDSAVGFRAY